MSTATYDVVILTDDRYVAPEQTNWYIDNILTEDGLVRAALEKQGLRVARKSWSDPTFDWSTTHAVLFRTTWDYFDRYEEWKSWLEGLNKQTQLINPFALIQWNMDKHYLGDLQARGINIPETLYLEKGNSASLREAFTSKGWKKCILKPCISGAARLTFKIDESTIDAHEELYNKHIANEAFMLQPFQEQVITEGEVSYMVMGGQFTHAVLKKAKPGDFRVQDDFGGTVHDYQPTPEEIAFAEKAIAACEPSPFYARVDVIRDNSGDLAVIELEMIEPELWFRLKPEAADLLAEAIVSRA